MAKRTKRSKGGESPVEQAGTFDGCGKRYSQIKNQVEETLNYWVPKFNLTNWNIRIEYLIENDPRAHQGCAAINSQWFYQHAHLKVFLPALAETGQMALEYTVVHELSHAIVSQMRKKNPKNTYIMLEEAVVTNLAKSFMRVKYGEQWNDNDTP